MNISENCVFLCVLRDFTYLCRKKDIEMKNIVIAAGYATRLGELTKNFPKPLLKIGNSTILGRMLDDIDQIAEIDEHIIITNHKFAGIFEEWKKDLHYSKPITIVDDGTETNETRLGAVRDLIYAINGGVIPGDKEFSILNCQLSTMTC